MKTLFFALSFILISCESEGRLTGQDLGVFPISPQSVLVYSGEFLPTSGIQVSGTAGIYQDGTESVILLENFTISSGPDLKIYLSTSADPNTIINLGALGNGMTQAYPIPAGVDFGQYDHVLIHCQQYNHLYAIAPLIPIN